MAFSERREQIRGCTTTKRLHSTTEIILQIQEEPIHYQVERVHRPEATS